MPKLGEGITEGAIVSQSVKVGDVIQKDDVLFEVNMVKVGTKIPLPVAGKVVEILFREGDTVAVGTVAAVVDMGGKEASDEEATGGKETPEGKENASSDAERISSQVAKAKEHRYSPVVIQLARGADIPKEELDSVQGTGYEGRLSKEGIKDYIEKKKRGISEVSKAAIPTGDALTASIPSSTGRADSITTSSVAASVRTPVAAPSAPSRQAPTATNIPGVEVKEVDRVRRIIVNHVVISKKVLPHVINVVEVDVTRLVHQHERNKDTFFRREGARLIYMPVITEAVAKALAAYPQVSVSVNGYDILFRKHIDIGIAVSLNDGNLIVPVVHNADHLNLDGLAVAIGSLVLKARDNKLMPDDIDEGTFTVTNFGTFKSLLGASVIGQPQVAILGVGYIGKKPAVIETPEGDTIIVRHKMCLSLSYDHRVVSGILKGNLLHLTVDYLENWEG